MPTTRTTRARAAAASQETPDASAKNSKIPQTTRKASADKDKEETPLLAKQVGTAGSKHELESDMIVT